MLTILKDLLLSINVIVALLIILIVLMQRPKNEGLGSAFGGGMTENLFGAQTTNVLANITRWLGGIFFAVSLLLTYIYAHESARGSSLARRLRDAAVPVAPATPVPGAPAPGALTPGATSAPVVVPAPGEAAPAPVAPAPADSAPSAPAPGVPATPATPEAVAAPAPAKLAPPANEPPAQTTPAPVPVIPGAQ